MSTWPPAAWATAPTGRPDGSVRRRVVVVTGASSGLGLAAAAALLAAGATVVLACRDRAKAERVVAGLVPADQEGVDLHRRAGEAVVGLLDLARPASIDGFARWFTDRFDRLDVLVNNAGVLAPPQRLSPEGIELQWATNHLGHFALTGLLLPTLSATPGARVVTVASVAAAGGRIRGDDPVDPTTVSRFQAYANSKLANLVFAVELERRLRDVGPAPAVPISLAAHPGLTHTNVVAGMGGLRARLLLAGSRLVSQPVSRGVQPILRAATDPAARGGTYLGPSGTRQWRGRPAELPLPASALRAGLGPELWARSMALSGVRYLDGRSRPGTP